MATNKPTRHDPVSHAYGPTLQPMITLLLATTFAPVLAAAGWAFLTYICGGGLGLAIAVFVVLKLLGR